MSEKCLKVAPWALVPRILSILKSNWPDSLASYYTLEMYHKWKTSLAKDLDAFLLAPDGALDEYGTFVLVVPEHRYYIVFDSLDPDVAKIKSLLINCNLIDWFAQPTLSAVHERFRPALKELFNTLNLERCHEDDVGHAYYVDKEVAKQWTYICPPEVYIAPVKEEHAELINSIWIHNDGKRSLTVLKDMIHYNGGLGVFLKDSNLLVSWSLYSIFGGPAILQTLESHRRKGYAKLAAQAITKFIAEKGIHPQVFIMSHNIPSKSLFTKLGYRKTFGISWSHVQPKQKT